MDIPPNYAAIFKTASRTVNKTIQGTLEDAIAAEALEDSYKKLKYAERLSGKNWERQTQFLEMALEDMYKRIGFVGDSDLRDILNDVDSGLPENILKSSGCLTLFKNEVREALDRHFGIQEKGNNLG